MCGTKYHVVLHIFVFYVFLDRTQLCAFLVYPSPQRVYEFSYIRRYEFIFVLSVAWNGTFSLLTLNILCYSFTHCNFYILFLGIRSSEP